MYAHNSGGICVPVCPRYLFLDAVFRPLVLHTYRHIAQSARNATSALPYSAGGPRTSARI